MLGARRKDRLDALAETISAQGGAAAVCAGDARDEATAAALVATALARFGRIDVAFNNAGALGNLRPATELTAEDWHGVIDTNLSAAFFGAKHQLGAMTAGGAILFTGSFVGCGIGFPAMSAYAASKAGLVGMVQALAVEHGARGVRINALLPGGTKTPMAGDFTSDPDAEKTVATFHALKRIADPAEIARVALFLLSDEASFITGAAIYADGGNAVTKG